MTTMADLRRVLDELDGIIDIEADRSLEDQSHYFAVDANPSGFDMHELHDRVDCDVRSTFYDKPRDCLHMAIWPESQIVDE